LAQRLRFEGTTSAASPSWRAGRDGPMWPANRKKLADLDLCKKSRPDRPVE